MINSQLNNEERIIMDIDAKNKSDTSTPGQKKMYRFDDIKHFIRRTESVVEIFILVLFYYLVWKYAYRSIGDSPSYYGNGKYVLLVVYAILIGVIFHLCDSFKFGHLKLTDVLISQWISVIIVNIVTYLQLSLTANRMINVMPILALTLVDFILCFALVYVFTAIYHQNYVPKNMVMIYGNKKAVSLKFKMDSRNDHYRVTKIINVDRGFTAICREMEQHDSVIINDVPAPVRNDILKYCYQRGIRTYVVPKISDIITRGADEISLFDTPLLLVRGRGITPIQRFLKRIMDIVLCLIALIPCTPVMVIIAIAIKLEDGGPVFYRQKRLTKGNKKFDILKFRSMSVDAEKNGYTMDMRATGRDPRITKVGNFIRACRADELPQILNILKGDMSIVGPRPERVENAVQYCEDIPEFMCRTKVKGGLTGYAQIYGKYNTSAYDKVRLDLMYIENYSILLDIKLIFMTLQILVKPESTEGFDKAEELEHRRNELLAKEESLYCGSTAENKESDIEATVVMREI